MNNSYLDIQYLNKISTVTLVCPRFLESVFTSHVNDVIILLTPVLGHELLSLSIDHELLS
jgi:hypothetical protein